MAEPDNLTYPERMQTNAVAEYLTDHCGAYRGSDSDAMTDAGHVVRAMQFAPLGDNHHNASMCPYCTPRPVMAPTDQHRVVVTALIWRIREDRITPEVLIMKRPPDAKHFKDVWVAPGGGVEQSDIAPSPANEFGKRALFRELAEEIGPVGVQGTRLFGHRAFIRDDGIGIVVLTYEARWAGGEPQVTPEAVEFAWISDMETGDYNLIGDTASEIAELANYVRPF